ncbi:hypothetical protein [Roseateles terrae]|uniref:Uncharacterized protein n=1 Tax=Roseateles terrae TaxID=431060 RepID=A0ABR6GTP4_9BURK|nr:hypothetical protein [Roseateles terrae]MBB3195072.1 hypothetical protein [Roseateles terrae]OWQ87105.1 hypothetical protein CDN98_09600 [Roseateles terrae]
MSIQPNQTTAAAAGVWAAVGGMAFEHWHASQTSLSSLSSNLLWGGFMLVFVLLPLFFFVIGRQPPFGRDWIRDPAERARYFLGVKRMLVWLVSAGLVAGAWTLIHRAME